MAELKIDDKREAVKNMLKETGDRSGTMDFIQKCAPSHLQEEFSKCRKCIEEAEENAVSQVKTSKGILQSAWEFLVESFESIRSSLSEIFGSVSSDWKHKVLEFIINKTVDLIEYITGFTDEVKIKAIVKCTVSYILCVSSAIAQN